MSENTISLAIETSCRHGGVAIGKGEKLLETRSLGTARQHASRLAEEIDLMFKKYDFQPKDLNQVYVSTGPGSYTGLRVAVAFASALANTNPDLKLVSVPTPLAIAERAAGPESKRIIVLLAAKNNTAWSVLAERRDGYLQICDGPVVSRPGEILRKWPPPAVITGEGTGYLSLPDTGGFEIVPEENRFPDVADVWSTGRRMAVDGLFTPPDRLRPVYAREPEAVRLWEDRSST